MTQLRQRMIEDLRLRNFSIGGDPARVCWRNTKMLGLVNARRLLFVAGDEHDDHGDGK